jgi:hydroxyacyl-ACP dehydratase HTD2-like protein with hotdog domain
VSEETMEDVVHDSVASTPEAEARVSQPVRVRALDVARFASAIEATDPQCFGESGDGVVAPPGFHFTFGQALFPPGSDYQRLPDGRPAHTGGDASTQALAAGTEIEFFEPFRADDEVVITERLLSVTRKTTRVGEGEFKTWERLYKRSTGELLVRELHSVFFHQPDRA